jgi:hypothetical protein
MQFIPCVSPATGVYRAFLTQLLQCLKPCVESDSPILLGLDRDTHAALIRQLDRVVELQTAVDNDSSRFCSHYRSSNQGQEL